MLLAPLAAACLILVVVFVTRERRPSVPITPAPAPLAAAPERTTTDTSVQSRPMRTRSVGPRAASRAPRRAAPPPTLTAIEVAPLTVQRLDVTAIVKSEQIEIDPIAIMRIEIAPMP
jgi:hypothetical protein